jgi:glycine oxidase
VKTRAPRHEVSRHEERASRGGPGRGGLVSGDGHLTGLADPDPHRAAIVRRAAMARAGRRRHIVVVGGGITGAFTAYFLTRLGAGTTLVERDEIGGQASGNNPGGLNPLHGPGIPEPMQELALRSLRLHLEHSDSVRRLSGIDFSQRRAARLHLALDECDLDELERVKEPYDSTPGFSANWVEGEGLLGHEPRLNPAFCRGLRTEGNAKLDSRAYTRALTRSAAKLGAKIVRGDVQGLNHRGRRVTGVVVDSGSLSCDGIVIAAGPWCAEPARWLGIPIPVEPLKGELLLARVDEGGVATDVVWRDAAVYGTGGDEVWLGGTEERVGFDRSASPAARASILDRVAQVLPGMRPLQVLQQTAALRPVTPDGLPIAGIPVGWDNVCLALGGGRKGVLLSAALGQAAAELIACGSTRVPVRPCSPERWAAAAAR